MKWNKRAIQSDNQDKTQSGEHKTCCWEDRFQVALQPYPMLWKQEPLLLLMFLTGLMSSVINSLLSGEWCRQFVYKLQVPVSVIQVW